MVRRFVLALLAPALLIAPLARDAHAESRRWVPVPGKSLVGFDASHPLGDFSGASEQATGEFEGDTADLKKGVTGWLAVAVKTIKTGDNSRDRDTWKAFEPERFPEIRFAIERVESSFPTVSDANDVLLTIHGTLTIHGVSRPMTFPGRIRLREGKLWVRGESRIKMSDFGIPPPRRLLLKVQDSVLASFNLNLTPAQ
ncbi:MAG TPA: YceI family protein [Methylomirabilota bacterium]|nr:YceI family protein [Methylomirabilota bacterium]